MCVGVTVWFGIRMQAEALVGLSLFNYQDNARSNKHKTEFESLQFYSCSVIATRHKCFMQA